MLVNGFWKLNYDIFPLQTKICQHQSQSTSKLDKKWAWIFMCDISQFDTQCLQEIRILFSEGSSWEMSCTINFFFWLGNSPSMYKNQHIYPFRSNVFMYLKREKTFNDISNEPGVISLLCWGKLQHISMIKLPLA